MDNFYWGDNLDALTKAKSKLGNETQQGTYIMYNQAPDLALPKPSQGPFSRSLALTPHAPMFFGLVPQSEGKGLPFAVVEASRPLPHTDVGAITGYRWEEISHNPGRVHDGKTRTIPRAACCWSPNTFPHFLDPEATTFTLADFVTAEAVFVLEGLLAIVRYLACHVPRRADTRSHRIRLVAKREILTAMGNEDAKSFRQRAGNGSSETGDDGSEASHELTMALGIMDSRR